MEFNEHIFSLNASDKRYIIHQGGTRSGKTHSILQFLLLYMMAHPGVRISIAGQSIPHLKRGVMADIKDIIAQEGWEEFFKENKTNHTRTFILNGSYMEFFSASSASKLRGPKRDILFINECNNIGWEAFRQLDVRTSQYTLLDFNPLSRFWVHKNLIPVLKEEEHTFFKSTYKDNMFLTAAQIATIERQRSNANWWRVYGEGETGNPEGKVFVNWSIVKAEVEAEVKAEQKDKLLPGANVTPSPLGEGRNGANELHQYSANTQYSLPGTLLGYGIDFGFSHSPTAVVQVNEYEGQLWVKEHFYKTATHNEDLFNSLKNRIDFTASALADPSAPQTIDFLYRKGWRGLKPAKAGQDSVEFGLNLLLERHINVSAESIHLISELEDYEWDTNKEGEFTSHPKKINDHAIDALRYVISYPPKRKLVFA